MKRMRLLTPAEEISLARRIERGDRRARERMVEGNLRLVFALAQSYRGRGVPFPDLCQEGTIGLIRAVERFDHRREVKFSTYAVWWIRSSLRDAVSGARAIRIPPQAGRQLAAVRRAEHELTYAERRSASSAAVARSTGLSESTVCALRRAARVTASLDEPVGDDSTPLGDLLADEAAIDPASAAIAGEERRSVPGLLNLLPARHREVLVRRYGLNETRPQSYEEIGRLLGVGDERCRQIEHEALHRLRASAHASKAWAA